MINEKLIADLFSAKKLHLIAKIKMGTGVIQLIFSSDKICEEKLVAVASRIGIDYPNLTVKLVHLSDIGESSFYSLCICIAVQGYDYKRSDTVVFYAAEDALAFNKINKTT